MIHFYFKKSTLITVGLILFLLIIIGISGLVFKKIGIISTKETPSASSSSYVNNTAEIKYKVKIEKVIGNTTYFLRGIDRDFNKDFKMISVWKGEGTQSAKPTEHLFFDDLPLNGSDIAYFWVDELSNTIFLVDQRLGVNHLYYLSMPKGNPYQIEYKSLLFLRDKHGLVGMKIEDYFPSQKKLLVRIGFGDGCGGGGTLNLVDLNGNKKQVVEYGVGCALPELPRFLGVLGHKIYMANYEKIANNFTEGKMISAYTIDPLSGEKNNVDMNNLPKELNNTY